MAKETTYLSEELSNIVSLSENDIAMIHRLTVDFYAASFAGYRINREFNAPLESIFLRSEYNEKSSVLLYKGLLSAPAAAFMNAIYAHGAELDDGNKKAMGHIGAHVIPAVFALAEKLGSSQEDVLIALATGYEAYIRISSAAQPGMVKRGFHSTGMAGSLACAAGCARLYHLNAEGIENSIALATTMSSGLLSYGDSRPEIKPLNPAKAAEAGVQAAMLAASGIKGPEESLEGPNGWFHAVTSSYNEDMLKGASDGHLLLHDCYIKLYPSCRHTHCGIEAGIRLNSEVNLADIEKINVYIYPNAIKLAGQIRFPKTQDETKFSIHYTLACALANGRYGIGDMNHPDLSEIIIDIIKKIELIPDESMENREKGIRGTRINIILKEGNSVETTVLVPKGDPENPLSREDVINKLRICAGDLLNDGQLSQLVYKIENIGGNDKFIYPLNFFDS